MIFETLFKAEIKQATKNPLAEKPQLLLVKINSKVQ